MTTTEKRAKVDRREASDRREGELDARPDAQKDAQGERRANVDRRLLMERRAGA